MKSESKRPVTIEDLLCLKRAERPPTEFWSDFDRKLRAKQLAALVEKRPWWQTLPNVFSVFTRYRIPLGAAAAVAITVFSISGGRRVATGPAETPAVPEATVASALLAAGGPASEVHVLDTATEVKGEVLTVAQRDVVTVEPAADPADIVSPGDLSRIVALGGGSLANVESETPSPATRAVAANLMALQASEPLAPVRLLGAGANGFESRAMPARSTVEPLQQITPPSESRRSRMMTAMVSTAALETSARTTERAASRISDEQLYDQIQRFGARGDRLQVKF